MNIVQRLYNRLFPAPKKPEHNVVRNSEYIYLLNYAKALGKPVLAHHVEAIEHLKEGGYVQVDRDTYKTATQHWENVRNRTA